MNQTKQFRNKEKLSKFSKTKNQEEKTLWIHPVHTYNIDDESWYYDDDKDDNDDANEDDNYNDLTWYDALYDMKQNKNKESRNVHELIIHRNERKWENMRKKERKKQNQILKQKECAREYQNKTK